MPDRTVTVKTDIAPTYVRGPFSESALVDFFMSNPFGRGGSDMGGNKTKNLLFWALALGGLGWVIFRKRK